MLLNISYTIIPSVCQSHKTISKRNDYVKIYESFTNLFILQYCFLVTPSFHYFQQRYQESKRVSHRLLHFVLCFSLKTISV